MVGTELTDTPIHEKKAMQIPQHVLELIKRGCPQQIAQQLADDGDKSLQFDGKRYVVSGYRDDSYFESAFDELEPTIDYYQSVQIK